MGSKKKKPIWGLSTWMAGGGNSENFMPEMEAGTAIP
jgi:hypothetical protein